MPDHHRNQPKPTYYSRKPEPIIPDLPVTRTCLRCQTELTSRGDRLCPDCNEKNRSVAKRAEFGGSRHRHDQVNKY